MTISVITGGCGFIGSHHVELLLSQGHEVRIIDDLSAGSVENIKGNLSKVKLYQQDINMLPADSQIFAGADYVFHFAGLPSIRPSLENPEPYMKTNAYGTTRVLECARHAKVKKFVYAASSACYGEADVHPTPETAEIKLQHPYGLSKHQGEESTLHWGEVFGLPVISLRMFDVYGPRIGASALRIFIRQKLEGKRITIVGDGLQTRDFVYVGDVCKAYLMAAESDVIGEVFNVGTSEEQTVLKIVKMLDHDYTFIPKRANEPDKHCADISKIKAMLGWEPTTSFEQGMANVVASINTENNIAA